MSARRIVHAFALLGGTLAGLAAARAEGNRLLPFWGQPYPYGFTGPALDGRPGLCPRRHRAVTRVDAEGRRVMRCEVVLHARD